MKLLTKKITAKLLANAAKPDGARPVLKLFNPVGSATWLISEMDPDNPDILYGLCDLGVGEPEVGYVSLSELAGIKNWLGLGIERDRWWTADKSLEEYADVAHKEGRIDA